MSKTVTPYSLSKDGSLKVGPHFRAREFRCKDGSDPIFISEDLVSVLESIRSHFGKAVVINSAYRTPSYNQKVGGVATSQHLYGLAADIVVTGIAPATVYAYADTLLANRGGVGKYKTFTHVDVREKKSRWDYT